MVPYRWPKRWVYLRDFISYASQSKSLSVEWKSWNGTMVYLCWTLVHFALGNSAIIHIFLFCFCKTLKCWALLCNSIYSSTVAQNINQSLPALTALLTSGQTSVLNRNWMAEKKCALFVDKFLSNRWTWKHNLPVSPPSPSLIHFILKLYF